MERVDWNLVSNFDRIKINNSLTKLEKLAESKYEILTYSPISDRSFSPFRTVFEK